MDPWSAVVDEVALEGLDGITIPTLWIRLENRQPEFPLKLDDSTKEFIWKLLIDNTELTFYEIPEEREDVVVTDRFKDADAEKIPSAHEKKKDIYPIHIIIKDGIQGSCAFFKERTDITEHVRSTTNTALISLEEALKRYGRKLVVVASQALRFRALIGSESDPDLKLTDDSFCVLERVGRGRWQGELQNELHGSTFKADARKLHYMRKSLVDYGLISMQPFLSRKKTGQQQHSILLMLKRFHVNRRSKYDILMEYVSDILQHLPEQRGTLSSFREQLNLSESCFKRVCRHMRDAKLVEFFQCPLEDLDPGAGPCTTKKGNKVLVRCMRLIKPYSKKNVTDDDEDDVDDNDEDVPGARSRVYPPQGRIMEKDILTQAYHIILAAGTKGVPQTGLGFRLNIGKLESRMLCRRLERDGLIKGFMVDEGRQRTTKFISHKCVGLSDQLQLVAKEQERKKLLFSSEPQASGAAAGAPKTPSSSKSTTKENNKTPAAKTIQKSGRVKGAKEAEHTCGDEGVDEGKEKARGKSAAKGKARGRKSNVTADQTETETPEAAPAGGETPACSEPSTSMDTSDDLKTAATEEEGQQSNQTPADPLLQSSASADAPGNNNIVVVKDVWEDPNGKSKKSSEKSHETYRLLRRKNLIVEAVRSLKVIEGLFPLQKMINDEEKQFGFTCKCCKKTITRLVRSLSREGLLKMYTTTVIQDGITKKVEMIVHPSIQPNDEIVQRVIEQVRFRISSSYSNVRLQHEEKLRELDEFEDVTRGPNGKADKRTSMQNYQGFKPTTVPGLGKTLGFQPKMHRLRIVHNFLWYLIYGHPLGRSSTIADCVTSETPAKPASSDPEAKCRDEHEKQDPKDSAQPQGADSKLDETSGEDEEEKRGESAPVHSQSELKVYTDEDSWKRFIPPVRVHKEFSSGWAMVADVLLCLPLSIFIQVIQINYKIDGLEEYLNDPVKQHYLVRWLPPKMRRQLLYRRKYLFSFHENLQKLVYMGLLQFGPSEKFMEKDQVFVYLKRHTTIVDTTNAEPHYWKIQEIPDKPFERRQYTFNTYEDVENYWFDLMCVCLNTPLGVIRSKRRVQASEDDPAPPFVPDRYVFLHLSYLLKGSREVCDDGSVPGDGKGAAGLDCEFFAHLKRNWLWTNHLLAVRKKTAGFETSQKTNRLKSLLSKHALRIALKAGGATAPRYLTIKKPVMTENVEVDIEPASRNQRVVGGKKQKRKRSKKEVVKVARKKKKEPRKRTPAHDEADHRALKMMTRQRVYWSVQEDSLMMLCSVASQLLNSKLKRPFIPYCVVRDLLHAEFEISMDKTSLAVGRRTRYILKNPQTLLNFRICLAEVYQDKSLMKLLEEKKPADPDKPEDCAEAFSEYARLLRQKFSSVISGGKMNMPDSKRQLFSRFKVSAIENGRRVPSTDTLNSTEDIHTIVLHNLIQSTLAMTNHQMKSSRSFQTFHMYSKYDQELLCQVFIQCRKRGLVNRRRVSQPLGPKKNRALPILPMSFQLSQSYYRCFSWRFPHSLCTDSFRFLRSLINNGMRDDRPLTEFHHEDEFRIESAARGSKRKDKQGGEKAEDGATKEPQPQPESMDGVETVVNDEVMNKTDEEKNPEEERVTAGAGEDSSSMEQQNDDQPPKDKPPNTAAEDPPDLSDMLQFSLDSAGGACVVSLSLMALGLLSVHLSIPKQMVVVDSNLVDNDVVKSMAALEEEDDDDDDGEDCEGRKKLEVKAHQASHTNYLMMRGYCCPGIVKIRNLNTNDNIVVESCTMKLQLRNTPAHNMFNTENSPPLDLSKCGPSLLPSILTYSICSPFSSSSSCSVEECDRRLIERGYTPQDIEAWARLRSSLAEAGENGLDMCDLHQVHIQQAEPQAGCARSLQQYMKDLQEENQVLKVGGQGPRWVLTQHADPWLLTVNTKQWSQSYFKSHSMPFLENEHNIPFMRKRCRAENQQGTEEPPSKKPAVDGEGGKHSENAEAEGGSGDITTEEVNKEAQLEKQKEAEEEGSGDKELNLGEKGGQQRSQEEGVKEDAGQEKMEEEKEGAGEEKMQEDKEDVGEEKMEEDKEDTGQEKMKEGKEDAGEEKMETEEGQKETTRVTRARRRSVRAQKDEEACSPFSAGEYVSFISRPWRMVDGTPNRQVCKGMLEGVMYHIMYRPGLTQQALVEHYKDVLQPVVVLDLVQALIDMGCVTKKTLVKGPKPSLFSRSVQPKKSEAEVKIEEPDRVFYEPTVSCCLRLSQVLPNERHWNNSAPSKCSSTPH